MRRCANCATDNIDTEAVCRGCGKPLAEAPVCPACGEKNLPGSRFCHLCGTALAGAGSAASPPSVESGEAGADGKAEQPRLADEQAWHEVVRLMNALADEAVLAQAGNEADEEKRTPGAKSLDDAEVEREECPSRIALAASVEGASRGPALRLHLAVTQDWDMEDLASTFARVSSSLSSPVRMPKKRVLWQQSGR